MIIRTHHYGALPESNGKTRFALWAPDAKAVTVELRERGTFALQPHEDGWFSLRLDCPPDTHYRYLIDDAQQVPDPAARLQVDDVHGWSCVFDHQAFRWQTKNWFGRPWHEAVIYELHVGLFGGYAGVEAYLPTLVELGVTAVELMPLNEFPGARNWGYDGVLLFAPEASYGTPDELKHLIDTAHNLGLMVFIDVVYNHFGPDGNYLGQYAKGFFREDIQTPWGAAIDFRRTEVRDFFFENALMWILDYRFDGLRLDAVHAISEKDFLVELAQRVRASVPPQRHVHLILENEDNGANLLEKGFDAQWNDDGHNVLHTLLTGEHEGYYGDFSDSSTAKLARCLNEGFIYQGETTPRGRARGEPSIHLPPTAFVLFLQNHDQVGNRAFGERLALLVEPDALKAATVLLLLSPMVPLLFMGEEWGSKQPFLFFTDHHDELAKAVCEGRRNEFADFSIFADPEIRERIPDPNAPETFTHSQLDTSFKHDQEHQQWYGFYRELLKLRRMEIVPRLKGASSAGSTILADGAVTARWMMGDGSILHIDLNLSENPVAFDFSASADNQPSVLFRYRITENDAERSNLPPHSANVTLLSQSSA